ncbi:hypothetical protein GWK47_050901 [Chionoecetes opilio]|uniref:Uncharacterized protein n=1 Tax=Chionoecetes opilio TaxID=41210 RepID=A0A8J4YAE0_CHIOP|nr:hypothetical protein GWK47_050901 [Chionoecetes opilio]
MVSASSWLLDKSFISPQVDSAPFFVETTRKLANLSKVIQVSLPGIRGAGGVIFGPNSASLVDSSLGFWMSAAGVRGADHNSSAFLVNSCFLAWFTPPLWGAIVQQAQKSPQGFCIHSSMARVGRHPRANAGGVPGWPRVHAFFLPLPPKRTRVTPSEAWNIGKATHRSDQDLAIS